METSLPDCYSFFVSNVCNSNCFYCSADWRIERMGPKTEIQPEILAQYIADIPQKSVVLLSGGEPTVYIDKYNLYNIFDYDHYYIIQTNAVNISENLINKLQHIRNWRLQITIGGMNELYSYAHNIDKFQQVVNNIRRLVAIKKETSVVELDFLYMKSNIKQIKDFLDLCQELCVDCVRLLAISSCTPWGYWHNKQTQEESQYSFPENWGSLIKTFYQQSGIAIQDFSNAKLNNPENKKLIRYCSVIDGFYQCISTYNLVFWPDGSVCQCCRAANQQEDIFSFTMYDKSLQELLTSEERKNMILNYHTRKTCQACLGPERIKKVEEIRAR